MAIKYRFAGQPPRPAEQTPITLNGEGVGVTFVYSPLQRRPTACKPELKESITAGSKCLSEPIGGSAGKR